MDEKAEQKEMGRIRSALFLRVLTSLWGIASIAGFYQLVKYSETPGQAALVSNAWPAGTKLKVGPLPSLVVFVHPDCSCSAATLGELERLLVHTAGKVNHFVVFAAPEKAHDSWLRMNLWRKAIALPGVSVVLDANGEETKRFGAHTSGQMYLYGGAGNLVFQGGLTPSRGHAGDSAGRDFVLSYLNGKQSGVTESRVFGCAFGNLSAANGG